MTTKDPRYPYTYAADFIRSLVGYSVNVGYPVYRDKLSRSEAAAIHKSIADVLGLDAESVAAKLADHYLANNPNIVDRSVEDFFDSYNLTTD